MQEGGALLVESSSPHALAESLQSADYSGTSSGKSKKRERPDQSVTTSKKGQLNEEYASPQKRECTEKLADKDGGLVTVHGIDQLILKMRQVQASSSQRIKLLGVVAMTTKEDWLRKFVQMGGVTILDEWIQDGFKSKSSDASSMDGDKGLDEEMLMILLALEKLPIDLEALKGCSIGKSVKRLRSAKNGELQRKARKLVDTWRKRVDFEMNQNSTICAGAPKHSAHVDSMSRSSDLSPPRAIESSDIPTAPAELIPLQEANGTLVSTPSNASTSDASPQAHEKSSISSDKDVSKKTARLCSTSGSTLSPAKRHKHLAALTTDKDSKDENSNATDAQKLKERDPKCENSTPKNDPNSNAASDTRKTNEYRKKLRSGGSSAAVPSGDLLTPSSAAQMRDNADEKKTCIDSNTGDSEQAPKQSLAPKSMNIVDANEAPDPPGLRSNITICREETRTETFLQGGKTEHVNESCLSSQSSCTNKRTEMPLMVTFDKTKMMSSHSLPQGAVHKSSTSDPELKPLNTSMVVALSKKSETLDTRQGGAVEGEESCCSYDNAAENAKRGSVECPSSDAALQKDACFLDGAGYSESNKGVRESEKEPKIEAAKKANETLATTHSCHEFDLNEGLVMEEFLQDGQLPCLPHAMSTSSALTGSVKATSTLSAPVAISAASKGAFIPPPNLMNKCDIGWKGSAATSAFRPAEPRHAPAKSQCALPSNEVRNVNSFDLNVADQGNFEDCPLSSGQRNNEVHWDLNHDGGNSEIQIATSVSESAKYLHSGSAVKLLDKRPMRDFDLNEQLDEVLPEQEMLSTSAARRFDSVLPFGGPSGHTTSGDVVSWHSAGSTPFPLGSANVPRTDQFFTGSLSQPASSRQTTLTTGGPPPLSSVVYSQTGPFFGGPQIPFPTSFAYSPASAGVDSSYLGSKMAPCPIPSTVGGRSRPGEASLVRPAFGTSMDDLRGGNDFYTWGRPHQNVYGGSSRPPTIISYNNATVGSREHVVNFDGGAVLEEQMRLYQQAAAVPVTPLKRKDSDYLSGLRQSTWH